MLTNKLNIYHNVFRGYPARRKGAIGVSRSFGNVFFCYSTKITAYVLFLLLGVPICIYVQHFYLNKG